MNLILLFPDDFVEGDSRVRLKGRRMRHVAEVHRAAVGDELRVGLVDDKIGIGTIVSIAPTGIEMDVKLEHAPPRPLPLTLVLALPRPKVLRRIVLGVTSMGIKRVCLLHTKRVEKSYWQSPFLHEDSFRRQIVLGLEQGCDTVMPSFEMRKRFRPFAEDELPQVVGGTTPLVAHPRIDRACPHDVEGPVTLAVGPEGGFIPREIETFQQLGFRAVGLGERVLKTEDVIGVLVGRLFS